MRLIDKLEKEQLKEEVPQFNVGDTVDVHTVIQEGEKERVQVFTGTVIGRKGSGVHETFTVRRIVSGEGVERTWPLHTPKIVNIVVQRAGKVRRAKLNYLRDRVGKATRVKESVDDTVRIKQEVRAREKEAAKKRAEEKGK